MKGYKMVCLMACMVLAGATVSAQNCGMQGRREGKCPTPTEMAEKRTARMTEALSLTPEQQEQVKQLNAEHAKRMEARRAEMKAEQEQLRTILTPEQYAKWEEMSKMGAHRHRGMKGGPEKKCCPAGKCQASDRK